MLAIICWSYIIILSILQRELWRETRSTCVPSLKLIGYKLSEQLALSDYKGRCVVRRSKGSSKRVSDVAVNAT